ncbi:MAG TPA: peptidoglycan-binding domain-containing protein [Solirubrobacteraceae bacterium]|nr:peptidoglycan-binding domain-containing protein [Solirubrobacteraceae bacterium]
MSSPITRAACLIAMVAACLLSGVAAAVAATGGAGAPSSTSSTSKTTTTAPKTKAPAKSSKPGKISLSSVSCVPVQHCNGNPHYVSTHGSLLLAGTGLRTSMLVSFPRYRGGQPNSRGLLAHTHQSSLGLVVTVPAASHDGHIAILLTGGRTTNQAGPIYVVHHALHPPAPPPTALSTVSAGPSPFDGDGMWIWYLSQSDGGSLANIEAQAKAADVTTLYIKSSDGPTNYWSQFSAANVAALHAAGLKVCAWQYVYGTNPAGEAALGVEAVAAGADCLVIDAETEYEGRYAAAETYIDDLRAALGPNYPIGLASFPYDFDHPTLPYSVFLGPDGAQYNLPQMYWQDIGTSVDSAFANTYEYNRLYGRPIYPLGQTFDNPPASAILRFRELASAYGATGISWWDWQNTTASEWADLVAPLISPTDFAGVESAYPLLGKGSTGDDVLWMQEHLATAVPAQAITGRFDATTAANLESFQTAHAIPASGQTDTATWAALLALPPVAVDWGTAPAPTG